MFSGSQMSQIAAKRISGGSFLQQQQQQRRLRSCSFILIVDREEVHGAFNFNTKTGHSFFFNFFFYSTKVFLLNAAHTTCEIAFMSVAFWRLTRLIKRHPLCHIKSRSGRQSRFFFFLLLFNTGTSESELHGQIKMLIKSMAVQLTGYGANDTRGTP